MATKAKRTQQAPRAFTHPRRGRFETPKAPAYQLSLDDIISGQRQQNRAKHQMEPLRADQVRNNAGGFVWQVDDATRLRRFLCLGSEGGSYYVGEKELTLGNATTVVRMIWEGHGQLVLDELTAISLEGRAAKQNPTLFCLALCARLPSLLDPKDDASSKKSFEVLRKRAYEALPKICRIPTHLFTFIQYCEKISEKSSGWGRAHRKAVGDWYLEKAPKDIAFAVTKYPSRNGWSHRDVLRLSHPKVKKTTAASKAEYPEEYADIFQYVCKGYQQMKETQKKRIAEVDPTATEKPLSKSMKLLDAVEKTKTSVEKPDLVRDLIAAEGLVREHVPTSLLNDVEVWRALLKKMPLTAMIRNLNKMTGIGLLNSGSEEVESVCKILRDENRLHDAKIHPFSVLLAAKTYESGRGEKGKLEWKPIPAIIKALDEAFYLSFKNVPPTGKRILIALDVSGSMGIPVLGSSISCRCASAAMSLISLKTEEHVDIVGFQTTLQYLPFRKHWSLSDVEDAVTNLPFGGTDCSLPMRWALEKKKAFDLFIIYTDSETWCGHTHPSQALAQYRREMSIPEARLAVVGMTASEFSIADPNDRGMLDIAGFDSAAPEVIRNFAMGHI